MRKKTKEQTELATTKTETGFRPYSSFPVIQFNATSRGTLFSTPVSSLYTGGDINRLKQGTIIVVEYQRIMLNIPTAGS